MLRIKFSRINQCWWLMFGDSIVEMFPGCSRDDVVYELRCRDLIVSRCGIVSAR